MVDEFIEAKHISDADAELIRNAKDGGVIRVTQIIKEGLELDFEVAKAIGIKHAVLGDAVRISHSEWDEIRGISHPTCEGDMACIIFSPSTDMNAAFAAAEKVGLFEYHAAELDKDDGRWYVRWIVDPGHGSKEDFISATTPALVLCAAILKLKGQE